jgi:hypothetical protein
MKAKKRILIMFRKLFGLKRRPLVKKVASLENHEVYEQIALASFGRLFRSISNDLEELCLLEESGEAAKARIKQLHAAYPDHFSKDGRTLFLIKENKTDLCYHLASVLIFSTGPSVEIISLPRFASQSGQWCNNRLITKKVVALAD